MNSIWIHQYTDDDFKKIGLVDFDSAREAHIAYEQLQRVFAGCWMLNNPLRAGCVYLEVVVDSDLQDGAIRITPAQGVWLVTEFFPKAPRGWAKKIRVPRA